MFDIDDGTVADIPVLTGFVNGVITYVTAFISTVALYSLVGTNYVGTLASREFSAGAEFGFVFYGGHFVPLAGEGGNAGAVNYAFEFAESGVLYTLLVVLLLVSTGYNVAAKDAVPTDVRSKLLAGASIALGYVPLAVAGGLYFTATAPGTTYSLVLWRVVLIAGVLLPVGLGGLGGYAASKAT